jgi:hypothetical protein
MSTVLVIAQIAGLFLLIPSLILRLGLFPL